MDVNHAYGTARFLGTVLALTAVCRSVGADDSVVEVHDQPSMLVVTASDDGETVQQSSVGAGTELIIRDDELVEPATAAEFAEGSSSSARGSLSVVANSQQKAPLSAIIVDSNVTPAAATQRGNSWGNVFGAGPRRPGVASGIQAGRQRSAAQTSTARRAAAAPKDAALVMRGEAKTQARGQGSKRRSAPVLPTGGGAGELLVEAYQLSLTASSEEEYSQIVRGCADAMRKGLDGENRKFGLELSAWALNRRGQIRADLGQRDVAVADFRAALEFDPQCWRALHNRGVTFAQGGQFAEAFDDVTKVIQINPQFAKAYSNRATLYMQAGDFEKALCDFQSALAIDPAMAPALIGKARVCHLTGRLEEALASFDAAIEQDDAGAETVCSRGDLLVDLGRYGEALQDYARAIDMDPKFEHAYRNGAWLLATCPDDSIRDADGAIKGAQAALACDYGERHAALDTLAAALANAGRFEEAIGTLQQAIEIAPEAAVPAYQARQQLYETGQPFRTHPVGQNVQTAEFVEG